MLNSYGLTSSAEDLESLEVTLELLADTHAQERIAAAEAGFAAGEALNEQQVRALIDKQARTLWVPNWSSTSCDLGVFVDQSVEPIATSDVKLGWRRRWW